MMGETAGQTDSAVLTWEGLLAHLRVPVSQLGQQRHDA